MSNETKIMLQYIADTFEQRVDEINKEIEILRERCENL
jgi:hypothetical protein